MEWFARDFDHPDYFTIYEDKAKDAAQEGPALARLLDLPPGSLVLDLPCGWGRLRPFLEKRGFRVAGGDLSPMNLARHRRENPGSLVRLDLRDLPFRAGCADGIFCAFTSWGYFATDEENQRQLDEFARVLRPGGVLLLDLAGRDFYWKALARTPKAWFRVEGKYLERVRQSPDGRRMITDRICGSHRFRHEIWIPTDEEARRGLEKAGLRVDRAWGDLQGGPWRPLSPRWIYRCVKPGKA